MLTTTVLLHLHNFSGYSSKAVMNKIAIFLFYAHWDGKEKLDLLFNGLYLFTFSNMDVDLIIIFVSSLFDFNQQHSSLGKKGFNRLGSQH